MLSKALKRVLLEQPSRLPPTFLLPWAAGLNTLAASTEPTNGPPPSMPAQPAASSSAKKSKIPSQDLTSNTPATSLPKNEPIHKSAPDSSPKPSSQVSSSVREFLPLLRSQTPHYITVNIYGNPYLLTQGDTVRLPFFMHGVEPGDVLRLNCAVNLGSRDFTLKAPAPAPKLKSPTNSATVITDPTTNESLTSKSMVMPSGTIDPSQPPSPAPHFIPHIAQGKVAYLDENLFVCRAVVLGVESEPMRIKEKTKRRQRHVKKVKSKHRFSVLKIKELRIRSVEEIESGLDLD